jgi:hypothetical protein
MNKTEKHKNPKFVFAQNKVRELNVSRHLIKTRTAITAAFLVSIFLDNSRVMMSNNVI